jgi:ornithine cyclodeaminase/alanine dehydrogenase-like protein (mu-crystallin family)
MTQKTVLQLHADEVWSALATVDPVEVLAEGLISRTVAGADYDRRALARMVPWCGLPGTVPLTDPVLLERPVGSPVCVASATTLCMAQAATMAALAARKLLVPGGVTVAFLGVTGPAQPQLAVLARHVPDISHVALWVRDSNDVRLEPELVDQLELSGIGVSVTNSMAAAVFGANLVVAAGDGTHTVGLDQLHLGHLAPGVVLVNATGHDLPGLPAEVDRLYVDDIDLLPAHRHREVVAAHLEDASGSGAVQRDQRIVGDLGQLLAGRDGEHRGTGEVVRVELLGVNKPNAELAYRIYQAAAQRGLGVHITMNGG